MDFNIELRKNLSNLPSETGGSHLFHLPTISLDLSIIKFIDWNGANGVHIICQISGSEKFTTFTLFKSEAYYKENVAKLKKAVGKAK